jgi:hypothetical protein
MEPSIYVLRVTAGPEYQTHIPVAVNSPKPLVITTDAATIALTVHIKGHRPAPSPPRWPPRAGPTVSAAPPSGAYFATPSRATARYGLRFSLTPRRPLSASDVELGNDFDAPVRALLPPGFAAALRAVSSLVDPGLRGDPYADRPYLYGPLVSSANVMRVGNAAVSGEEGVKGSMELDLMEGAEGEEAEGVRRGAGVPEEAAARRKWFLDEEKRKAFTFEEGRTYDFDFGNSFLNFNGEVPREAEPRLTLHDQTTP